MQTIKNFSKCFRESQVLECAGSGRFGQGLAAGELRESDFHRFFQLLVLSGELLQRVVVQEDVGIYAVGIPEEQLREAAKSAVCKINIDSDSRLAMTAAVRKVFNEKPGEFDPRKYLGPARDEMKKLYVHKIVNVLGSNGKAE